MITVTIKLPTTEAWPEDVVLGLTEKPPIEWMTGDRVVWAQIYALVAQGYLSVIEGNTRPSLDSPKRS